MFERFAAAARSVVREAAEEARQRGDRRVGTEHLLLAALNEPTSSDLLGVTAETARAAADELDRQSLAAIGIDLGDFRPIGTPGAGKRPPFNSGARQVLSRTLTLAAAERSRRIETRHLLAALLERDRPDPIVALLSALGIDPSATRARLQG
ncbi:Clp protease N-terminal domain-containing protein [Nocardia australiensis]|uniref:Clp protease N-terminal domain-containing protein n=1 Tax=Nocardia australiensis TaxID=2887191 RepID=UPI001D13ADCC|nr:Clp protease N-terminal domain-containing protein [Nocardia australiensis]